MEKEPYSDSNPVLKNYRHFILHPTTKAVDEINDYIFNYCAKKWAAYHSFFPVLRLINSDKIFIKLYYHSSLSGDHRQLEELSTTCYRELIPDFNYSTCNIIRIPMDNIIKRESILECVSMKELEALYLSTLTDESYVGCNEDGGGLTLGVGRVPREFKLWNRLIDEGYLTPEYEEQCKLRRQDELLGIKPGKEKEAERHEVGKIEIQVFSRSGGEQPLQLDAQAIDKFFKGNYAKVWAMTKGFIANFNRYESGIIYFDMISDPRFKDNEYSLSRFIANEYKKNVNLLKDACSYKANHYKAKDIIGYLLKSSELNLLKEFDERVKRSYAGLSDNPDFIHSGQFY